MLHDLLYDLGRIGARLFLWSWKRAAAGLLALLVLLIVTANLTSRSPSRAGTGARSDPGIAAAASAGSASSPAPALSSVTPATTVGLPSSAAPAPSSPQPVPVAASPKPASTDPGIAAAADKFTRAWVAHNRPAATWLAALRPYATARLASELATADPANVPCNTITGPARVGPAADGRITVTVPTDTYPVRVVVIAAGRLWQVDTVTVT